MSITSTCFCADDSFAKCPDFLHDRYIWYDDQTECHRAISNVACDNMLLQLRYKGF